MPEPTFFTREEALDMQEALISAYGNPEFQVKLRVVLKGLCTTQEKKEMDQELREVRENVGARFGFEPSPEGVKRSAEMFTLELLADPEIKRNFTMISNILSPQKQDDPDAKKNIGMIPKTMIQLPSWDNKSISLRRRAELAAKIEAEKTERKKAFMNGTQNMFMEEVGRHWTVTAEKGLLVRKDEDLKSREYQTRLARNSIIEEEELIGNRLHYKKVAGDGPDFGWVSIVVKGTTLVCPLPYD